MKLRFSGWLGALLVAATVLVAVISLVWTPYDPTLAHPDAVSYTHLTLPTNREV